MMTGVTVVAGFFASSIMNQDLELLVKIFFIVGHGLFNTYMCMYVCMEVDVLQVT